MCRRKIQFDQSFLITVRDGNERKLYGGAGAALIPSACSGQCQRLAVYQPGPRSRQDRGTHQYYLDAGRAQTPEMPSMQKPLMPAARERSPCDASSDHDGARKRHTSAPRESTWQNADSRREVETAPSMSQPLREPESFCSRLPSWKRAAANGGAVSDRFRHTLAR